MRHFPASITLATVVGVSASPSFAALSDSCQALLAGERITIAVPNTAGGGYDTYARALAPVLEQHGGVNARVANMPSGGGLAARSFVMNGDEDSLNILIENAGDLVAAPMGVVGRGTQAGKEFMIEGFATIGIVHSEPSAWIGRAGLDLLDPGVDQLIASEGGLEEAMLPFFVTGRALGINVDAVIGYEGTSEMAAAILRGEADISSMSLTTSQRRARDEGIDVLMVMSDGPYDGAPDTPYLAGEGGVVWQRTAQLPEAERDFRRGLASAVTSVRATTRGLFVSTNLSDDRRACISDLMDIALFDPAFAETAEAQDRPVAPVGANAAAEVMQDFREAYQTVRPILDEIAAELMSR